MKKPKIVQVGVGHDHAFACVDFLKDSDLVEYVGVVVLNGEENALEREKERYNGVKRLTLEEALNFPNLDGAIIETEDDKLTEYAYKFIERKIAVQMDKPGSQDKKSFNALFNLAKKNNVPLHMGYMYRYNPAVKKLVEMKEKGELGKITGIEAKMSCIHGIEKRKWLSKYKGGMLNFLGCHLVDIIFRLQGTPKKVIPLNKKSVEGIGEDVGFAVLEYENGVSYCKASAVEYGGFSRRQIVVNGEKATVEINPTEILCGGNNVSTEMYISKNDEKGRNWGEKPEKITFESYDRYKEMYIEFIKMVNKEIENPYSYEYEISLHNLLLKCCGK